MFEFSQNAYKKLLLSIQERGYRFIQFRDVQEASVLDAKSCLMRHDIDASMGYAIQQARMEALIGVRSTFFVMLRSPLYNIFSRDNSKLLREIVSLGHGIGLHFDAAELPGDEVDLLEWLKFEMTTLATLANAQMEAFSFHQPSSTTLNARIRISKVVNTYDPDVLSEFKYISDSNRTWRSGDPYQLMESGTKRLHILTHPMWWMCEEPDPHDCWDSAIQENFKASQSQLLRTERAYGSQRSMALLRE